MKLLFLVSLIYFCLGILSLGASYYFALKGNSISFMFMIMFILSGVVCILSFTIGLFENIQNRKEKER